MSAKGCLIHLGGNYKFIFADFFCHVAENFYLCAPLEKNGSIKNQTLILILISEHQTKSDPDNEKNIQLCILKESSLPL